MHHIHASDGKICTKYTPVMVNYEPNTRHASDGKIWTKYTPVMVKYAPNTRQ